MADVSRLHRATMNAGAFLATRYQYQRLQDAMRKAWTRSMTHVQRLYNWTALRTKGAAHLATGTVLHRFYWRNSPPGATCVPSTVRLVSAETSAHGADNYQYITVEDVEPNWLGKRRAYRVPLHWFCDPALYDTLLAQGIDVSAHDLQPQKGGG